MSERQQKKERKARKRKKRLERERAFKRQQESRARRLRRYPPIVVSRKGADPEFIAIIDEAVSRIDFDDSTQFSDWHRTVFKMMAEYGASYTRNAIMEASQQEIDSGKGEARLMVPAFHLSLGERIFGLVPEEKRREHLPYNDMSVHFAENAFVIEFTQLESEPGPRGTAYYSRHRPTVSINGKDLIVAFSRHAVERICERLNPRWLGYSAAGDVHAVFSHCKHFEPVTLYRDQPAFTFYDHCDNEEFVQFDTYIHEILGKEEVDRTKGRAFYRVGYCPVAIEGEFAKAKTFLYPGFTATPEYGALLRSGLPHSEKERLQGLARVNDATNTIINQEVEVIRWFHENGVPQVIETDEEFFDFS